jgi:hypothetical protein
MMIQDETSLPEGTDKVIAGASVTAADEREQEPFATEVRPGQPTAGEPETVQPPTTADRVREQVRTSRDKLSSQAAEKTRGLVAQGIERGSEALGNVSRLVGDTAEGLDERLGTEYGDYARKAAEAIDSAARKLAQKDADELIDDARTFVQRSPGVAIAGAAIAGFALVRLLKAGLEEGTSGKGSDESRKG